MRRASLAAILALVFTSACASTPKADLETLAQPGLQEPPVRAIPAPTPEEEALARRAEADAARHLAHQAELLWTQWVGLEAPEGHEAPAYLFEAATVRAVERVATHADEARRWERLHRFLAAEFLDRAVRAEDEALGEGRRLLLARGRAIVADGEEEARVRAGEDLLQASEEILPTLEARTRTLGEALAELEYASGFEAAARLAGIEPAEALRLAESILRTTDSLWDEAFHAVAERALGLSRSEVRWIDFPRVLRSAGLEVPLRARRPQATMERSLARLGLELGAIDRLFVDAESREGKETRSLCLPLPGGARLAIPEGGGPRHGDLLRDLGCALAAAQSDDIPAEPILRAFGGLFARLTASPDWLVEVGGMTGAEARARSAALGLRRLFLLRHHAALVLAEAERGEDLAAFERAYARHMGRAIGLEVPGAIARLERTTPLEAIDLLRGELLASLLHEAMGEGWWDEDASKAKLGALLDAGAGGPEALLTALGREALEVEPFVAEIRAALAPPEA